MATIETNRRFAIVLLVLYCIFWAALGIAPLDRDAWWLENVLVFIWVPVLVYSHHGLPLSKISYSLLFVFFCLHAIGSHYTYQLVPYDSWWVSWTGQSLNAELDWERNNYDRIVHFAFGLLLTYPWREFFVRIVDARGFWGYSLPVMFVMAMSMFYELIEWAAAVVFGSDVGMAFLGTQGDEWDGHRDMALASLGALIAMTITLIVNLTLQRDFAREWQESLAVKGEGPMGERIIGEMLDDLAHREGEDPVLRADPRL
jgi:putative membrane protein